MQERGATAKHRRYARRRLEEILYGERQRDHAELILRKLGEAAEGPGQTRELRELCRSLVDSALDGHFSEHADLVQRNLKLGAPVKPDPRDIVAHACGDRLWYATESRPAEAVLRLLPILRECYLDAVNDEAAFRLIEKHQGAAAAAEWILSFHPTLRDVGRNELITRTFAAEHEISHKLAMAIGNSQGDPEAMATYLAAHIAWHPPSRA